MYWILLFATPIVISFGDFKISKITQSGVASFFLPWWSNVFNIVIFGVLWIFTMDYVPTSATFWLLICGALGVSSFFSWVLKMVAFSNDRVSRVSPIFYLESVFSLMFDYFIFHVDFGLL